MRTVLLPPSSKEHHGHGRGFTLIEVLASLLLITIVLPVAMRGLSLGLTAASVARQRMVAASLAETKLSELIATGAWQSSPLEGDFGPDWNGYKWTAELDDWVVDADLRQLTLRVQWTRAASEKEVALSTLVIEEAEP